MVDAGIMTITAKRMVDLLRKDEEHTGVDTMNHLITT